MTDPEIITETDIDLRPVEFGFPVTDDDLMTYEEWWSEFNANACCKFRNSYCACGGSAQIPSGLSRFLHNDEEVW